MAKKKSNNTTTILITAGVIGAAAFLWLRSQLRFITFGGVGIPFQQLKDGRLNLVLRLSIINASALAARVTGFTGFILTPSGAPIATVFLSQPVRIPRFGQAELDFKTSIGIGDVLMEAGEVVTGGNLPTNWAQIKQYLGKYKLVGQVRIFGLPVPLEMPLV